MPDLVTRTFQRMVYRMWLVSFLMMGLVAAQDTPEHNEATELHCLCTDEDVRERVKKDGVDLTQSFRCGLFLTGEAMLKPLYFLPKLFPTECPADEKEQESFNTFCTNIFKKISKNFTYEMPSIYKGRADEGFSMGDDICNLLKRDYGVINVGEQNKSKKFKEGLEIGMYSNSCGNKLWNDTTLRLPEGPICCEKGRYKKCVIKEEAKHV